MIRLAVRVRREQAELVLADLLELAPAGVEEVELDADTVEYAVYGAAGELPTLPDLEATAAGALVEIYTEVLPDDWSERWKQFHRPVMIEGSARDRGAALHVRPPWAAPSDDDRAQEIVIDPAQAFGTGAHATTRLCLELLLDLHASHAGCDCATPPNGASAGDPALPPRAPGALLDVGTGSGVLAIAAARLGYGPVLACDHDPESVAAARANARANGVSLAVTRVDLRHEALPAPTTGRPPTVLANLLKPLLLDLSEVLPYAPPDLIASGLLVEEVDEVARAFAGRLRLRERERRVRGEWAALWMCDAER